MFTKLPRSFFLAVLLVISLGACSEEPQNPIRVGTNVWPGYEPAYLAQDLGYFDSKQVKLSQFQSASESIRAFRNNAIDIVALTLDEALLLIQDGLDLKIILVSDISDGGDVIMAVSDIKTVSDLKGRRVGVESSALGAYVLARALEIHNVPFQDVELVHLTVDASEQAFQKGTIDAVVSFEPYRSRLKREGAVEIFSSREMPNEIVDILVVRSEFADQNAENISTFIKSWFKAVRYIKEQPLKASILIGKRLSLTPEEARRSFEGLILPDGPMNANLLSKGTPISLIESAGKLEKVLLKHKLLNTRISLEGVFTDKYVR